MTNNSQPWIEVKSEEFDRDTSQTIKGVVFHVSVSPYDIPRAVRGRYDKEKARFLIEFKYVSAESQREHRMDEHVILRLGEHSGRLYAIEADVQAMKANAVLLSVEDLIDESNDSSRTRLNYEAAKRVIEDNAPELWQSAPSELGLVQAAV